MAGWVLGQDPTYIKFFYRGYTLREYKLAETINGGPVSAVTNFCVCETLFKLPGQSDIPPSIFIENSLDRILN